MPPQQTSMLRPAFAGLYFDDFHPHTAWLRDEARLRLPPLKGSQLLRIHGEIAAHPGAAQSGPALPTLQVGVPGGEGRMFRPSGPGTWTMDLRIDEARAQQGAIIYFKLGEVGLTNALAWLGRISRIPQLQHYRQQARNRQLRISKIETADGRVLCDFSLRMNPFNRDFMKENIQLGINVAGFITADLGIGESARCMLRAAAAAKLAAVPVQLKLPCKNPTGDDSFKSRLSEAPIHAINIFHIDPPVSQDIDHHEGPTLRAGRYNIGYWAWELPEFPDAWTPAFKYFDEIWCPSDFVREAVAEKSPVPVLTIPHAVAFERPEGNARDRFGLPRDRFLFLFLYDLNSYSARKNPQAVVEAFRLAGLASKNCSLVIKVHNVKGNEGDYEALKESLEDLPQTTLIEGTLSRQDIYLLESGCDAFVSLHRSEGFGFALAECMYLGKPVISTDWSATAEFINDRNGCPVRCELRTLDRSHGPYGKGARWADPDIVHAAWWMRRLAGDKQLCESLGRAARGTIESRFSPAVVGARYRRRLESIALF